MGCDDFRIDFIPPKSKERRPPDMKCKPTQHNYVQLGTKDKSAKVFCTKCGDVRKV